MTARTAPHLLVRNCASCGEQFSAPKPSSPQRFCSHGCAIKPHHRRMIEAARAPEAVKKMADALRDRGEGKSYRKRDGRHEHRIIAEQKVGRALLPHEVAHHIDEDRRNNAPDNIDVMPRPEHSRLHTLGAKRPIQTVCKFGHDLVGDNVEITWAGNRRCITCRRAYDREWKKARRRAANRNDQQQRAS